MNIRKPLIFGASIAALLGATALPASAAPTVTTFSLTGGTLTLSVQANATLGNEAPGLAANTITGNLGSVAVTDARGGSEGWVTSAVSSAFTGSGLSTSNDVRYTTGAISEEGTNTLATGTEGTTISTSRAVASATEVSGPNSASWIPTLDVLMPAFALAGAYSGTVTTSVL